MLFKRSFKQGRLTGQTVYCLHGIDRRKQQHPCKAPRLARLWLHLKSSSETDSQNCTDQQSPMNCLDLGIAGGRTKTTNKDLWLCLLVPDEVCNDLVRKQRVRQGQLCHRRQSLPIRRLCQPFLNGPTLICVSITCHYRLPHDLMSNGA